MTLPTMDLAAATINLERRSFQIMACDGTSVLANVPLDEAQLMPLVGSVLIP